MKYFIYNDNYYADLQDAIDEATISLRNWMEYEVTHFNNFEVIHYSIHTTFRNKCVEVVLKRKVKKITNGEEKIKNRTSKKEIKIAEVPMPQYRLRELHLERT